MAGQPDYVRGCVLVALAGAVVLVALGAWQIISFNMERGQPSVPTDAAPKPQPPPPTGPQAKSPTLEPSASSDFDESIKVMRETKERAEAVRLSFFDDYDDQGTGLVSYHPSVLYFTAWAARHMRWSDVNADETTHAYAMKFSASARGKRACFSGKVQELKDDELVGDPIRTASLWLDDPGGILKVVAVGDATGVAVDQRAKVCGVVIGTTSYVSALKARVTGVQIVGMFDTPKNRATN